MTKKHKKTANKLIFLISAAYKGNISNPEFCGFQGISRTNQYVRESCLISESYPLHHPIIIYEAIVN